MTALRGFVQLMSFVDTVVRTLLPGVDRPHPDAAGLHAERDGFTFTYRDSRAGAHTSRCVEDLGETGPVVSDLQRPTYPTGVYPGYRGYEYLGTSETPVRQAPGRPPEPAGEPLVSLREAIELGLLSGTLGSVKQARKRAGFPRHVGSRPAPGIAEKLYHRSDLAEWEARRRRRP